MIFAFLIFLINILSFKAISNFKMMHKSNSNFIFIIMPYGIYNFNYTNYNLINQYYFNISQIILSKEKFDTISLNEILFNSYIFIAKNFI